MLRDSCGYAKIYIAVGYTNLRNGIDGLAWKGWIAGRYFNLACSLCGIGTPESVAEGREYLRV